MRQRYLDSGGAEFGLMTCYLGDMVGRYCDALTDSLRWSGKNVILDVSSLPKRVFFPVVKRLLQSRDVRNLVAVYTIPDKYSEEELVEDSQLWTYLPTFSPPDDEPKDKLLIVGLGYEPLSIEHATEGKDLSLDISFPSFLLELSAIGSLCISLRVQRRHHFIGCIFMMCLRHMTEYEVSQMTASDMQFSLLTDRSLHHWRCVYSLWRQQG